MACTAKSIRNAYPMRPIDGNKGFWGLLAILFAMSEAVSLDWPRLGQDRTMGSGRAGSMEGIQGKRFEVMSHDRAHPRRVVDDLHLAHAFAEKILRISWKTLDEIVENARHEFRVIGAGRHDRPVQLKDAPRTPLVGLIRVGHDVACGRAHEVGHEGRHALEARGFVKFIGQHRQAVYNGLQGADLSFMSHDPIAYGYGEKLELRLRLLEAELLAHVDQLHQGEQARISEARRVVVRQGRFFSVAVVQIGQHGKEFFKRGDERGRIAFLAAMALRAPCGEEHALDLRKVFRDSAECGYRNHGTSRPEGDTKVYYDLHTHTVWSDGELEPSVLVAHAARAGVRVLAVTDHDTMDGVDEAALAARELGLQFVPGVELSVTWQGLTVHIVGLGVDADEGGLKQALHGLQSKRLQRGQAIVQALEEAGLGDARPVLEREGIVSRVHIADWLVGEGHARNRATAFKRFLTRGGIAYVAGEWAGLDEAVGWVLNAGGDAVLAHPTRYRLSGGRLQQLVRGFAEAGGAALEVVTAGLDAGEVGRLARLAHRHGLCASVGSDFHKTLPWRALPGGLPDLPEGCRPIWERWSFPPYAQEIF